MRSKKIFNIDLLGFGFPDDETDYYYIFIISNGVSYDKKFIPKFDEPYYLNKCFEDAWEDGQRRKKAGKIEGFRIEITMNDIFKWPIINLSVKQKISRKPRSEIEPAHVLDI